MNCTQMKYSSTQVNEESQNSVLMPEQYINWMPIQFQYAYILSMSIL